MADTAVPALTIVPALTAASRIELSDEDRESIKGEAERAREIVGK